MTHDRKLLIVADDGFTVFVSTRAALAGEPAIVGYLQDLPGDVEDNDPGEVNVNVSPDDRFAFVSDEQNLTITVIDLSKARGNRFSRDAIVGQIPVANAPIALTFSRDGRYLFTTSEIARRAYGWPKICRPEGAPQTDPPTNPAGAIITIDVQKAESDPEHSIVSEEPADCSPVRMSMSPDGATLWVSNRASNTVTEFTTEALIARSEHARIATIAVGSNPVPILASRDGRYVLVGETNRFGPGGTGAGVIAVIDATSKKVVGSIPVGTFPREFSYGVGATIFLANYRSNSLTIFDAARIADLVTRALPSLQTKGN
ncbi:MAG TPA: hypothetical protein VFE16_12310 [Candidatus Cybelea sp.]|nr:hypothetical protein [Candidatus Cybelea sp.]